MRKKKQKKMVHTFSGAALTGEPIFSSKRQRTISPQEDDAYLAQMFTYTAAAHALAGGLSTHDTLGAVQWTQTTLGNSGATNGGTRGPARNSHFLP